MDAETKVRIIEGILSGKTLKAVVEGLGLSSDKIYRACRHDPVFSKDLAEARAHVTHDLVDSLETIADGCRDLADVGIAKLKSDNIKWVASKRAPQVYGDRIDVNVTQTIDLSQVLRAAESRTIPLLEAKQRIIDAAVSSVSPHDTETSDDDGE